MATYNNVLPVGTLVGLGGIENEELVMNRGVLNGVGDGAVGSRPNHFRGRVALNVRHFQDRRVARRHRDRPFRQILEHSHVCVEDEKRKIIFTHSFVLLKLRAAIYR